MVRPGGPSSNTIVADFDDVANDKADCSTDLTPADAEALFEELERWHEVLKPHADELRGPRP